MATMPHQNGSLEGRRYGEKSFPAIIDSIAHSTPDRVVLSVAKTANPKDGYIDISYGCLAQAIDRCAFWLEARIGRDDPTQLNPIFSSLPRQDLRGLILNFAAPKTGHQMYWAQPFAMVADVVIALKTIQCKTFLEPEACPKAVSEASASFKMQRHSLPSLDTWFRDHYEENEARFEWDDDLDNIRNNTWMVSQTSGTTGPPKPIHDKYGQMAALERYQEFGLQGVRPHIFQYFKGKRVLTTFGWYQYAGVLFGMLMSIYFDYVCYTAPAVIDWTPEKVDEAHRYADLQGSILYPLTVVQLAQDEPKLKTLDRLEFVMYGGSTVPRWAGDKLAEHTDLLPIYGSTELALPPQQRPHSRHEWDGFDFTPIAGAVFKPFLHQYHHLVFKRVPGIERWQAVFANFPDLQEWSTGDLFEQHPSRPGLWRSVGRVIDCMTLKDGRKFNPIPIEDALSNNPCILMAMVVGESQTTKNIVVLLTPRKDIPPESPAQFVDSVYDEVVDAFASVGPAWLQQLLAKDHVLVCPPGKPILRTGGKWNVNRSKTLAAYSKDIKSVVGDFSTSFVYN